MLPDWNAIRAEYIAGASYGVLASRHGLSKSTVFKKSQKEQWDKLRERTANAIETRTINRTADKIADNAALAQDIRRALLERLQRTVEKFPQDATEVRAQKDGKTIVYRLSDITKAYKDLTDDLQVENTEGPVTIIWGR